MPVNQRKADPIRPALPDDIKNRTSIWSAARKKGLRVPEWLGLSIVHVLGLAPFMDKNPTELKLPIEDQQIRIDPEQ
jgi:hypothetical protein